jgi:two-component sensor histidine kinase
VIRWAPHGLRTKVGGETFLDWRILLFVTPAVVVGSTMVAIGVDGISEVPEILLANLISVAAVFVYVFLLRETVFKDRSSSPTPLVLVLIASASVGFVKGFTMGLSLLALGVESVLSAALDGRVAQSVVAGLIVLPGGALLEFNRREFQKRRDELVSKLVAERLASGGVQGMHSELAHLKDFIQSAKQQIASSEHTVSEEILQRITQEIRPLSNLLLEKVDRKYPNYTARDLFRSALTSSPFSSRAAIIFATAVPWAVAFNLGGFQEATTRGLLQLGLLVIFFTVANLFQPKSVLGSTVLFSVVVSAFSVTSFLVSNLVFGQATFTNIYISIAANGGWITLVTLGVALIKASSANDENVQRELDLAKRELSVQSEVQDTVDKINSRELANKLHSSVQNRLLSAALHIKSRGASNHETNQVLQEVSDYLDELGNSAGLASTERLSEALLALQQRWSGFIELKFSIFGKQGNQSTTLLVQVIEEAISNSSRHGNADLFTAQISFGPRATELILIDNGIGPKQGKKGLGYAMFSSITNANFSVEACESGGTEVRLRIQNL